MDTGPRTNGDKSQRARLARILRDPSTYFADARRHAHQQARRYLADRMASEGVAPSR